MNCNNGLTIRPMERADTGAVVELMARAFQNAALYRYLEPDADKRPAFLRMIFSHRIDFGFESRDADLAVKDGKIIGAVLWGKPGTQAKDNHALNAAVNQYSDEVAEKWQRFHDVLFSGLSAACPEPHWSVAPIAVMPEAQGQGVASALLKNKFIQIDAEGALCLLGTQDKVNTQVYARYNFRIVSEVTAAKGCGGMPDLICYTMLRDRRVK